MLPGGVDLSTNRDHLYSDRYVQNTNTNTNTAFVMVSDRLMVLDQRRKVVQDGSMSRRKTHARVLLPLLL